MAFDYTHRFQEFGTLVKAMAARQLAGGTTLPAQLAAITAKFNADNTANVIANIYTDYAGMYFTQASEATLLAGYMQALLLDPAATLIPLGVDSTDLNAVLRALYQDMLDNSQTAQQCTVNAASPSYDSNNVGNGVLFTTIVLDGVTPPLNGVQPNIRYAGVNSELAVPAETMTLTCTADAGSGAQSGAEVFRWDGGLPQSSSLGVGVEGSGVGPQVTATGGTNLLNNGGFTQFNNNTPSSWTATGQAVAGSTMLKDAATFYRGGSALKFVSDGVAANLGVSQAVRNLAGRKMYAVVVSLRSNTGGSGVIQAYFSGTGYTASSSEKVNITAAAWPNAAWVQRVFFIVTPAVVPADFALQLNVAGVGSVGDTVWFGGAAAVPVQYHGGVGCLLSPGVKDWAVGDKISFAVANDVAGVFQNAWRRAFLVQLPSSGSPSIPDSWAM